MNLKSLLAAEARRIGFDRVGVARVGELEHSGFFREWIAREYHGDMDYLATSADRRLDPGRLLAGARSVICVAKNYRTDVAHSSDPSVGVVSRYAWGEDYHDLLMDQLEHLKRFIEKQGAKAKVTVDTGAVLEKLWARQAGLGWQGKHSNLMNEELSSWFFLGVVLTDADLEPDRPVEDRCGSCTSCIDVCPTRAIVAPYVVDARKCISYLTIEQRGPIPRELRPLMGNLIFGCDLCQDVCPWNSHAKVTPDAAFYPREELKAPKLAEFLPMTREEFAHRFKGSPIKRAKRSGFLRNVCVAIGNSGDRSAIPSLARALVDDEPLVRGHAAWALGRLGGREELVAREPIEADAQVREEIRLALAERAGNFP